MIELNAAQRLAAGAAEEIAEKVKAGQWKIVDGQGERWMAVKFPNGRFGVVDSQAPGTNNAIRASGLDEKAARRAVAEANKTGKYHPTMTMRG